MNLRWRKFLVVAAALAASLFAASPAPATASASASQSASGVQSQAVDPGRPASEAYPWMARIETDYENRWCSGALISPRWVLTTASCIHWHEALDVHIGSKDLYGGGTVVQGYWELKHESFTDPRFHIGDDIALVSLAKPVSEKPIKIADSAMVGDMVRRLGAVHCSGCTGRELREVDTKLLDISRCNNIEPGEELCSTLPRDGAGFCPRESGGPLVAKVGTEWRLVGLAARYSAINGDSSVCGDISTNVPYYRAWAEDKMQKFDDAHPGG
ncbi:S1 family peptidase [Streptomyces sp. KR80]|uniref:S1 family peptidase n=1 Tax=Streptomyces sp. KR80 TaxID=3457426 RepID=UPI003FD3986C